MTNWKITWREEDSDRWRTSTIVNNWPEILPEDGETIASELVQAEVDGGSIVWMGYEGHLEISEPSQIAGVYQIHVETHFVVTASERARA